MWARRALICSTLLCAACSGAEARRSAGGPAPGAAAEQAVLPYESPARWEVHPSPLSYMTAAMRLADGSCLLTEHSGQRWLTWPVRKGSTQPALGPEERGEYAPDEGEGESYSDYAPGACSGEGRAAVDRAPEPLVGIVRWAESFGFLGESGTIHEAKSPLGRFTRRIPPPEPLARVRGAGRTLLAVTETGRVLRWEDGRGYEPVALDGTLAFDLAVSPSGRAIVAGAPEALFTTEDGGRHFTRAAAPSVGVQRVGRAAGGPLLVEGVGTTLAWDPHGPAAFTTTSDQIGDAVMDVEISAGRSPNAGLVTQGRAAIDGDRYWEASSGDVSEWALWKGTLDGRLTAAAPDAAGPDDSSVLVAASGSHVALGIVGWSENGTTVRVRRSHDGAVTFGAEIPLVLSSLAPLGLAVARDGAALVTGACRPPDGDAGEQCTGGPLVVRGDAVEMPRAPALREPAIAPAFSPDGQSAYFLAEAEGDRALSLFVSHDGGASFEERELRVEVDGDERTFEAANETAITVSETGTLGVLVALGGGGDGVWLTTDADGRGARVAEPPSEDVLVGGFGERVLAVEREAGAGEQQGVKVWESLDRGATWREEEGPVLLRGSYRRSGDVACGLAGCLIGGEVTRVGWGAGAPAPLPFERQKAAPPPRGLRVAIVCEPRAGSSWTHIDHVHDAYVLDERSVALGRAAWMVATHDPASGAAGAVVGTAPPLDDGARVKAKQLLGPAAKGTRWASLRSAQIEGDAVARVALGPAGPGAPEWSWKGRRLKNLEIAWENLEEGTTGRAVIADAGPLEGWSVRPLDGGDFHLSLDVLSISPKGIFVRATPSEAMSFVETSGKARSFDPPDWPEAFTREADGRSGEAVNVDGTFVMTKIVTDRDAGVPTALLLAPSTAARGKLGEPWTPFAVTVAPPDTSRLSAGTDWTYEGGHLAVAAWHAAPATGAAATWLARILPGATLGAWSRLPTPFDLPSAPRGCTAAEHRDLPRVRVPAHRVWTSFPGTRHPVLIDDGAAPEREAELEPKGLRRSKPAASGPAPIGRVAMLSAGLVLRGTPASPCVDAFVAYPPPGEQGSAVILGDLRHGWLFRPVASRPTPGKPRPAGEDPNDLTGYDVRPLACRFDPSAPVPDAIIEQNTSP